MSFNSFALIVVCLVVCTGYNSLAQGIDGESGFWAVGFEDNSLVSVRFDPNGEKDFGRNLVFAGLQLESDGERTPVTSDMLSFDVQSHALIIDAAKSARLIWSIDFGPEGFFDRLTGVTRESRRQDSPALFTFMSGAKGHTTVIESFKRLEQRHVLTRAMHLWLLANPGRTAIIQTADNAFFALDHGAGGHSEFVFEEQTLKAMFLSHSGRFVLRPHCMDKGLVLESGQVVPRFSFGRDMELTNSLGGSVNLNSLLNEFFMQASFWYPAGSGGSEWSALGAIGNAYHDTPYRQDTSNGLMSQVIGDDGYGHDGYAYSWGTGPGWPFPKGYDTRHFIMNAFMINAFKINLLWTGDFDAKSGIDFSMRGTCDGEEAFAQNDSQLQVKMQRNSRYRQSFETNATFDSLAFRFLVHGYDPKVSDKGLEQQQAMLPESAGGSAPLRLSDVDGQTVSQRIKAVTLFNTVGFRVCSWGSTGNGLRARAFDWKKNREESMAVTPIGETVVTSYNDNSHVFVELDHDVAAGGEVLLVVDRPTQSDGKECFTGLWCVNADDLGSVDCVYMAEDAWPGHALRVKTGVRVEPMAAIRLLDGKEDVVFETTLELATGDGFVDVALSDKVRPGAYAVEVVSKGGTFVWRASLCESGFKGHASRDGHTWNWLDRARHLMEYQLDILNAGEEYLLKLDGKAGDPDHSGIHHKTVGNNYYDILPFGYYDAYANAWFYLSLKAMAELETAYGNPDGHAAKYEQMAAKCKDRYNEVFWTENGHQDGRARYIGCVDITGAKHDYGFTFINTLAVMAGLASEEQSESIFDWLDNGSSFGPNGAEAVNDIYKFAFGPRTTTIDNPDWWAVHQNYESYPWGDQIQNGGADLYESYYDLMARLAALDADNAFERFVKILERYAEPDRLTGGAPLYTGESVQGGGTAGAAGIMSFEFPETATLASIVVYGFLGCEARADGLHIRPRVPSSQPFVMAQNIDYHGAGFTIKASANSIVVTCVRPCDDYTFKIGDAEFDGAFIHEIVNSDHAILKPVARHCK